MQTPDRADKRLLEPFGISAEAETVWRRLLSRPNSDREQLCRDSDVTATALDSALGCLMQKGLVETARTSLGVAPVDPSVALGGQISRAEREATQVLADLADLRATLSTFSYEYSRGRVGRGEIPSLEVVIPIGEIRQRLEAASEELESEHRCLMHSVSAEGVRHGLAVDLRTLARGVRQRSVIREADLDQPGIYPLLETLREHGESTRVHPNIPTHLMIFDRKLAVVRVHPYDPKFGAMFIRVSNLIELLIDLFDRIWEEARPLFVNSMASAPNGRAGHVLALVANGVTDDSIARTLRVSRRTVGREISELKTGLGVSSRTEIVGAAIRRGWL